MVKQFLADYWRKWYLRLNGITCGHCSKAQKAKCKGDNFWVGDCPKAIHQERLDTVIQDENGNSTPLHELIADDNADFIPRLEAKLILESYPKRFVELAYKNYAGYPLTSSERNYYYKEKKRAQKSLV